MFKLVWIGNDFSSRFMSDVASRAIALTPRSLAENERRDIVWFELYTEALYPMRSAASEQRPPQNYCVVFALWTLTVDIR